MWQLKPTMTVTFRRLSNLASSQYNLILVKSLSETMCRASDYEYFIALAFQLSKFRSSERLMWPLEQSVRAATFETVWSTLYTFYFCFNLIWIFEI